MRKCAVAVLGSSLLLLFACGGWPPHRQEVVDHFFENEAKLNGLRSKLIASNFSVVSLVNDGVVEAYVYDELTGSNRPVDLEILPDERQWLELFSGTHITVVGYSSLDSNSVAAGLFHYSGHLDDETIWEAEYIFGPNLNNSVAVCSKDKPTSESGTCGVALSGDWWLRYVWRPK